MTSPKAVLGVMRAARPTFRNAFDYLAFAVHADLVASGYRLVATGPDAETDPSEDAEVQDAAIDLWNSSQDSYVFRYVTEENLSRRLLVKGLPMGDALMVEALPSAAGQGPFSTELKVSEYITDSQSPNVADHFKDLEGLVEKVNRDIVSKLLAPGSAGASKDAAPTVSRSLADEGNGMREAPSSTYLGAAPPFGAGGIGGYVVPPVVPGFGGSDDLTPGPGGGVLPDEFRGGFGGGMLVGPNDPRWGAVGPGGIHTGGRVPGVPPGARFDPYGPPGMPGFEPDRFGVEPLRRPPGGRGQGPPTHPDLEFFNPL